jgi:hypothetical protein
MTTVADLIAGWLTHELQQATGFTYDRRIARYRNRETGRLVAERDVIAAADGFRDFARGNIDRLTERFVEGDLDLPDWQRRVAAEARDARLVSAMAGRGGRNAMQPSDWGRVGGRLRYDLDRLNRFAIEIKAGMLTPAQIKARARLYAKTAQQSYNDGRLAAGQEAQVNLEWIVGPTEHCGDCLRLNGQVHSAEAWAASGWQPQSSALECGGFNCQCSLVPTDADESGGF